MAAPTPLPTTFDLPVTTLSLATNNCGIFGDLVPNVYIDRVFLEESQTGLDVDNDGKYDQFLQTPKITVDLKLLDTVSDGGTFSILGDALEIKNQNGTVDFKKYFKINCIMFTSDETAQDFITNFENTNYFNPTGYFGLFMSAYTSKGKFFDHPKTQIKTKTLSDFRHTYVNSQDIIEITDSVTFELEENDVINYLRLFAFVELDTKLLGQDLIEGEVPDAYKTILSRYYDQLVIENSHINPKLTVFLNDNEVAWDGPIHVHYTPGDGGGADRIYMEGRWHTSTPHNKLTKSTIDVFNVQDFRIRDQIQVYLSNFTTAQQTQNSFPQQADILNSIISNNSYTSDFFITKDANRDARFYFAFDYGAYVLENIPFSKIVATMSETSKKEIVDKSKIVGFTVSRRQVEEHPARNHLGSPLRNRVFSDTTINVPVISDSLDDPNITEIDVLLIDQPDQPEGSLIRHFTGVDMEMKDIVDGAYQYSVDIEIIDGFIPVMREYLANFADAVSFYNDYVALVNIPNVYDPIARKFTPSGQQDLYNWLSDAATPNWAQSPFGPKKPVYKYNTLTDVIGVYLDTLELFVDLDQVISKMPYTTLRMQIGWLINLSIHPVFGTVDGVLQFETLVNDLLGQINDILSVGSNSVGVEATTANRKADSISSFKDKFIKTTEVFENTIDARFLNESYINNINATFGGFSGLNVYNPFNLSNATITEVTPESEVLSDIENFAKLNITFEKYPGLPKYPSKSATGIPSQFEFTEPLSQNASNYLGQESKGAFAELAKNILSNIDLEKSGVDLSKTLSEEEASKIIDPTTAASLLQSEGLPETGFFAADSETQLDILTSFSVSDTTLYKGVPVVGQTYMIRGSVFKPKTLAELVLPPVSTSMGPTGRLLGGLDQYYLCRQIRRSDMEVVDCFFFLRPPLSTELAEPEEPESGGLGGGMIMQSGAGSESEETNGGGSGMTMQSGAGSYSTPADSNLNLRYEAGAGSLPSLEEEDQSIPYARPTQADRMMRRASEQLEVIEDQNYSYEIPQENKFQRDISNITPQKFAKNGE